MNLARLLEFIPLIIGVFLAYHLVFKKDLPSKGIISMLTYILGIVIVLFAARWLVTTFVADWATDLLSSGTESVEWDRFIDASSDVFDGAFSGNPAPQPTPVQVQIETIVVTAVPPRGDPSAGQSDNQGDTRTGPIQYTVQMGDTLTSIASRYNVTVQDIMRANNLYSADFIQQGQVLIIPAAPQ